MTQECLTIFDDPARLGGAAVAEIRQTEQSEARSAPAQAANGVNWP